MNVGNVTLVKSIPTLTQNLNKIKFEKYKCIILGIKDALAHFHAVVEHFLNHALRGYHKFYQNQYWNRPNLVLLVCFHLLLLNVLLK